MTHWRRSTAARFLVFRIADLACAAELESVREVIPAAREPTRIPGAHTSVVGLINVRGELFTLVDGRSAMGQSPGDGVGSILLLDVGKSTVGFRVDEVLDLFEVPSSDLAERSSLPGIDPRIVRAVGQRAGVSFVFLDLDALLGPVLTS